MEKYGTGFQLVYQVQPGRTESMVEHSVLGRPTKCPERVIHTIYEAASTLRRTPSDEREQSGERLMCKDKRVSVPISTNNTPPPPKKRKIAGICQKEMQPHYLRNTKRTETPNKAFHTQPSKRSSLNHFTCTIPNRSFENKPFTKERDHCNSDPTAHSS